MSMARDLSFIVTPPWQLVGERRNWVNELQITNDAGLLVARAVVTRENQKTPSERGNVCSSPQAPCSGKASCSCSRDGPRIGVRPRNSFALEEVR